MEILSKKWVLILINASLVIVLGFLLLLVPIETLKSFIFIIGIITAFIGLVLIFGAFNYAHENKNMLFWLFQGLFNMVVGGILIFFPEESEKFLLILGGLWVIILGVYQFSISLVSKYEIKGKTWHRVNGLLSILIGFILIFAPELFSGVMLAAFGSLLIFIGGGMVYLAILLNRLGKITEAVVVEEVEDVEILPKDDELNP